MEANIALYRALITLRNADNLAPFKTWLQDQREKSRDRLETFSGDNYRVEQGRAAVYKEISELIEGAPTTLEKIESRRP
jgi:hypothetical protein